MRILLAAKYPPAGGAAFGGVASWSRTIADVFTLRGHECVLWGPKTPLPERRFDVGVISNPYAVRRVLKKCDRVLCVSHGVIPEERPPASYKTVFTSEEVKNHWDGTGPIVRQPIDLRFWNPRFRKPEPVLLFYSYRSPDDCGLRNVADALRLRFVHLRKASHRQARDMMLRSAVVCASGRAALEAMACGAVTVICDHRPYNEGPLICGDMDVARAHNYSGRGGEPMNATMALCVIWKAMQNQLPRAYVTQHHDADKIADKLLSHVEC